MCVRACVCGHACACMRVCEPPQENKEGGRLENYGSCRTGFHPGKSSLAVPPGEVEEWPISCLGEEPSRQREREAQRLWVVSRLSRLRNMEGLVWLEQSEWGRVLEDEIQENRVAGVGGWGLVLHGFVDHYYFGFYLGWGQKSLCRWVEKR